MEVSGKAKSPGATEPLAAIFLRIDDVARVTGLGRSTIYRLRSEAGFPAPVRLATRVVAWRRTDVEKWGEAQVPVAH